jgi:hypothetical protein
VEVPRFVDRFTEFPPPGDLCSAGCEAHRNFADESICLLADKVRNKALYNSQTTGDAENGIYLHADITVTDRNGSDLPFEAVLQEYLQFPYEYLLLILPFGCYCCKFCSSNNRRRKNRKD